MLYRKQRLCPGCFSSKLSMLNPLNSIVRFSALLLVVSSSKGLVDTTGQNQLECDDAQGIVCEMAPFFKLWPLCMKAVARGKFDKDARQIKN